MASPAKPVLTVLRASGFVLVGALLAAGAYLIARTPRPPGAGATEVVAAGAEEPQAPARELAPPARVPAAAQVEPGAAPTRAASEASSFFGRVIDDESGSPLVEAVVTAEDPDAPLVTTDASGLFRWEMGPDGFTQLRVDARGHAPALLWTRFDHGTPERAWEVRLRREASLEVWLVGAQHPETLSLRVSAPLAEVVDGGEEFGELVAQKPFGPEGALVLDSLVPRATLTVEVHGHAGLVQRLAEPVVLEPGERRRIDLDLRAGTRLVVDVVDQAGRPIADQLLWLTRRPETPVAEREACYFQLEDAGSAHAAERTDARGRAAFEAVPAGAWWLGPAKEEAAEEAPAEERVAPVATRLEISSSEREHALVLQAERGRYLRGRLVDPAGAPVARAFVGCEHETIAGFVTGDVDEGGRFRLGPVADGVHLVRAIPHGKLVAPAPVRAVAGGAELLITLAPGSTLAGRVVDGASGAPARADVVVSRADGVAAPHGSFGDDGAFAFSGLAAGRYALVARTSDGRAGLVEGIALGAGEARSDLRIELAPAARLVVRRNGGPDEVAFRARLGEALVASGALERGVPGTWFVPAGHLVVELEGAAALVREVDVAANATGEVVFELE